MIYIYITKEKPGQELKQKPWKNATWVTHRLILSFLRELRTTCSENGATHSGLGFPTPISNSDNLSQASPQAKLI